MFAHRAAPKTRAALRGVRSNSDAQDDSQNCEWYVDLATGNFAEARKLSQFWDAEFPDKQVSAGSLAYYNVLLGDFDRASELFERGYERREDAFFTYFFLRGFGYEKAIAEYRTTSSYKALAAKPLFKEWQAEHDRIAAALAAQRDPLN